MIVTGSRLNFACGATRPTGFENSDIIGGDVYCDLENHPYPYGDGTAELIMISHGLAMGDGDRAVHPNLEPIMWEFHRILHPGGWLRIDDNPLRIVREGEHIPGSEIDAEAALGFPQEFRSSRDDLVEILHGLAFEQVVELEDPNTTRIPCEDGELRSAIIHNHGGHYSFAIEAQK